jgi:hypothetical protein
VLGTAVVSSDLAARTLTLADGRDRSLDERAEAGILAVA